MSSPAPRICATKGSTAEESTSRGSSGSAVVTSEQRHIATVPNRMTAAATRLPSFVVTSSNDAGFGNSRAASPTGSRPGGLTQSAAAAATTTINNTTAATTTSGPTMTLNPEAPEFPVPFAFSHSLFAMPSDVTTSPGPPQSQLQQRFHTTAMDFSARPASSVSASGNASVSRGTPKGVSSPPRALSGLFSTSFSPTVGAGDAAAAAAAVASVAGTTDADVLDTNQLIARTEAYMHDLYDHKCARESLHMVSVFHLHPRTTGKQLSEIFFPSCAKTAEVLIPESMPAPLAQMFKEVRQRAGVVFFSCKDYATVGVEKVHNFVPNGQHQPLVVRYCGPDREPTALSGSPLPARSQSGGDYTTKNSAAAGAAVVESRAARTRTTTTTTTPAPPGSRGGTSAATPRGARASPTATTSTPSPTAAELLSAIDQQLRAKSVSAVQLAADMAALVLCTDSGEAEAEAERLATLLREVLLSAGDNCDILAGALSAALRSLHKKLGILPRTEQPTPHPPAPSTKQGETFLFHISRMLMLLVADTQAAHQTRLLAAAQCAHMFQYPYLPHTPASFADTLLCTFIKDLEEMKKSRRRHPNVPPSGAEQQQQQQHAQCNTLIEVLNRMMREWHTLNPSTYAQDRAVADYEHTVMKFRGLDMSNVETMRGVSSSPVPQVSIPSANSQQQQRQRNGGGACTPREEALGGPADNAAAPAAAAAAAALSRVPGNVSSANASAKKSLLGTPSARPTPRRAVSKSYCTTTNTTTTHTGGEWRAKQETPMMGQHIGANGQGVSGLGGGGGAARLPPKVMLTSAASDGTQGVSEGASAGTVFNSALRSPVATPQHPPMRVHGVPRSRTAATVGTEPGTTPPAPVAAVGRPSVLPLPFAASLAAAWSPANTTTTTTAGAATRGGLGVSSSSAATPTASSSTNGAERSDATMTECTVYITKLPSCLTAGQVRRLLLHFGDFRKVRLCKDDKETTRGGSAEALAAHQLKFHQLCFGFVEFAEAGSARAMVEFFRNEVHTAAAFSFLQTCEAHDVGEAEAQQLRNTRTSQARAPIHDQHPLDAARGQSCVFGLLQPSHAVDTYIDAMASQLATDGAQSLEGSDATSVSRTVSQPCDVRGRSMPRTSWPGHHADRPDSPPVSASMTQATVAAVFPASADTGAGVRDEPRASGNGMDVHDVADEIAASAFSAPQGPGAEPLTSWSPCNWGFPLRSGVNVGGGISSVSNNGAGDECVPTHVGEEEQWQVGIAEVERGLENLVLSDDDYRPLLEDDEETE